MRDGGDGLPEGQAYRQEQARQVAEMAVERDGGRRMADHGRAQGEARQTRADRHEAGQGDGELQG